MKEKNGLSLFALVAIGLGAVIGAGVVTTTGIAITYTGRSVWLAYALAVVLGFFSVFPYALLCSSLRIKGGNYSFVSTILGGKWGSFYLLGFSLMIMAFSIFALSFGNYLHAIVPALPVKGVAIAMLFFFYLINMFGMKFMSKVQNILSVILIFGLILFVIAGSKKLVPDAFSISTPNFFLGGVGGFFTAIMLLMQSTSGYYFLTSFSNEAQNAKRDIPLAMMIAPIVLLLLYTSIAFVTANVLPTEQVAGQPLTVVASQTMSRVVFYLFVIGGPLMALSTTLNSSFPIFATPLTQYTKDGWLPAKLGEKNKHGAPKFFMTLFFFLGLIPILLDFSIGVLLANLMLVNSSVEIIAMIAIIRYPVAIEGAWENRYYKISKSAFYFFCALGIAIRVFLIIRSFAAANLSLALITIGIMIIMFIYSHFRSCSGKVRMEKSYELQ